MTIAAPDDDYNEDRQPDEEALQIENDPLRTGDPYALTQRLGDKIRELRDRREAQERTEEAKELLAELKRDPAVRRAQKERAAHEKAEMRAARGTPHGTKSAMRAIGRFLTRCENMFDDLLAPSERAMDPEMQTKSVLAAARLASAVSSLGNAMSANARARIQLMRARNARKASDVESEADGSQP